MIWRWIIRARRKAHAAHSAAIGPAEIKDAKQILFAVFARYGDSIIAFKAIRQFTQTYPDKHYLVITTRQSLPYAHALVPGVEVIAVNKHRDPWRMLKLTLRLRGNPPDVAFNPWSHGDESEYFLSFARRFYFYRDADRFTREINLYRRVRDYLHLPTPAASLPATLPNRPQQIVIAPFSTDIRKSLSAETLQRLLESVRHRFAPRSVTLAAFAHEFANIKIDGLERFVFRKSAKSSAAFIALLRRSQLFIGVDAGPLHIADALGVPSIGLFGPTAPETILDNDSRVAVLRMRELQAFFCGIDTCQRPVCLERLVNAPFLETTADTDATRPLTLETKTCRALPDSGAS